MARREPFLASRSPAPDLAHLLRYQGVIPHFDSFLEACEQPLPQTVRVNTLRASAAEVRGSLEARGIAADPLGWYPDGLRLDCAQPGVLFEHFLGLVHPQEEASMVPPVVLAPRPGELVLDLCAAPGSKATQLAALMAGTGHVVANEKMISRLPVLRSTCERLGALDVGFTCFDGRRFPRGGFDRVLVDPPCSSEGMARRSPGVLGLYDARFRRMLESVQAGLLESACRLVRPGGLVVYSTCTYAPEEDEAQVARALGLGMELVAGAAPEDLAHAPGLRSWGGEELPEGMERCIRLYPHLGDTGGFFVAVLQRPEGDGLTVPGRAGRGAGAPYPLVGAGRQATAPLAPDGGGRPTPAPPGAEGTPPPDSPSSALEVDRANTTAAPAQPGPERIDGAEREGIVGWWGEHFGVPPPAFEGLGLFRTGADAVRVARDKLVPALAYEAVGLTLMRSSSVGQGGWRPTTSALQLLGGQATRGRVELDRERARRFIAGEPVELEGEPSGARRFVLAAYGGRPLGCGLAGGRTLASQVPKERRVRAIDLP